MGVRTRPRIPCPLVAFFIRPAAKTRVFPEPVAAPPITSFPSRTSGIAFSCISVGSMKDLAFIVLSKGLSFPNNFSNFSIFKRSRNSKRISLTSCNNGFWK